MLRHTLKILRYRLREFKNNLFNPLYNLEAISIRSRNLTVYKGTFKTVDKDDAWLAFLVRDASVFFDVGSNIGWVSLLANVYGSPRRVVLIDPNPLALTLAAGNLIMNGFSENSTLVKSFASDRPGIEVEFFTIGAGAAGSMFSPHAKTASTLKSSFRVPTTTLDEISDRLALVPDLVKIDVEGAEALVLNGMNKICRTKEVRIFIEMHSNSQLSMRDNASLVLKWCEKQGYQAWYLTDGVELTSPSQIERRGRCHLLLQKEGVPYPAALEEIKQGAELPNY